MPIELSGFDKSCIELLSQSPKRHSRSCFRSAFHHLECAERLIHIDPAMAVFRGITSEEEAASGLMQCLKERQYENTGSLNPRNHVHKNAVFPFLRILGMFQHEAWGSEGLKPILHISPEEGDRRLTIALPVIINGEEQLAYPIPPLNFGLTIDSKPPSYKKQIAEYIATTGAKDIAQHLKDEANLRNRILYAGPGGYPVMREVPPGFLQLRRRKVLVLLRAYLLIHPYAEKQPFVQDALDAFLAMLGVLKEHNLHEEI